MKPPTRKDVSQHSTAYYAMGSFWIDCLNLNEPVTANGSTSGLALYLNRYAKEDDDEFAQRIKGLAQVNFIDLVVDAYCSMLFSTDVQITSKAYTEEVDRFVNRCNPQGDSLKEYRSRAFPSKAP